MFLRQSPAKGAAVETLRCSSFGRHRIHDVVIDDFLHRRNVSGDCHLVLLLRLEWEMPRIGLHVPLFAYFWEIEVLFEAVEVSVSGIMERIVVHLPTPLLVEGDAILAFLNGVNWVWTVLKAAF